MAMESGAGTTETAAFTRALASLKQRGSNLLVVGAANDHVQVDACRRLLGERDADRTRLYVTTDQTAAGGPSACTASDATIEYATTTRGAAAQQSVTSGPAPGPGLSDAPTTVDDLPSLGRAIEERIESEAADGLDPAELRLCFEPLRALLEAHDEEAVFRFLHALTSEVRSVKGMGHYHLPVPFDNRTVRTLEPLFDAVVEVRTRGENPQQRWHLHEAGITTDWLDL